MLNVNVGMGQEPVLSPILLAFYFSPFFYILEKCLKNLNIPMSIIFSLMIDSLSPRANYSILLTAIFFVVIMLCQIYLKSLVL